MPASTPFGADSSDDVVITVQDTTAPLLALPSDLTVTQTSVAGAVATFTATATDLVSTPVVVSNPVSGSVFPVGQTTVQVTATDASGNPASGTFHVTVAAPTSNAGKVTAKGTIPVGAKKGKLNLTAQLVTGRPLKGSLSFTDPVSKQTVKSTRLTALVISGTKAQIYGEAKLPKRATVRFMTEVDDLGKTSGADRFRLELSDGRVFGAANLSTGQVTVSP